MLLDLLGAADPEISNFAINIAQLYEQLPKIETKLQEINGCMENINKIFTTYTLIDGIQDDHVPFLRYGTYLKKDEISLSFMCLHPCEAKPKP